MTTSRPETGANSAEHRSCLRAAIAVVAIGYLASALWMPPSGFWIYDTALKYIQLQAIADHGEFSLDWPGRAIDPEQEFGPIRRGFHALIDGDLHSAYSPAFPLLSVPFYRLLGDQGILAIPILGLLLGLPAIWRIARLLGGGDASSPRLGFLAVLAVSFATPLWFYALAFWEHTPAVGLSCWSVWACLQFQRSPDLRSALLTGVMAGLPVYFRTESYLFAAVVLAFAAWPCRKRGDIVATLAAGLVLALLPLWIFHTWALGNPLGLHVATQPWADSSLQQYLAERMEVAGRLLLNLHVDRRLSLLLAIPFYAALILGPLVRGNANRWGVPLAAGSALAAGGFMLWEQWASLYPMNRLIAANGLFSASPLLILGFLGATRDLGREASRARRTLLGVCLTYALLYSALIPGVNSQGIHWGNRFLLPIYPLLGVGACVTAEAWWTRANPSWLARASVAALFLLSFGFQVYSLVLLHERKASSQALNERVLASDAEIVVSDTWFIPVDLAHVFYDRPVFLAPKHRRDVLLARAREHGVRTVMSVDRDRSSRAPSPDDDATDDWLRFAPVSIEVSQIGER